ncbi:MULTISPECIES: DUF1501 domain-containing protein [unclassified Roseateles]|uniref:DUF1501 domain-containing protein n=1 Tax=unclassified Roseateles TaxID=2626991 RepID=UPI0006F8A067|nr:MULTISPECIES: DUF1501 domain-containing protein [unclassified Roseateles]KQW41972.1 hypothetical protein ASC81_21915 [Pelomonas sp. Root405]KRA67575.1 hypothetical protein ASD88_23500 [Pelomonas sp. Root662]
MNASRRAFLSAASGLAAAGLGRHAAPLALNLAGLGALAANQAQAATTDGYKALVCLFMHGGNDSHNWIVPMDAANYASYAAARGGLAVPLNKLLALSTPGQGSGREFGMPQELAPLRAKYEAGQCAVVANVGTLLRPISKSEYQAGIGLPSKLFSHNDQASMWQSLQVEGAPTGWGGRMGDALMAANGQPVFTAVGANGNAVFLSGSKVTPYCVGLNGPIQVSAAQSGWHAGSTAVPAALRSMLATSSSPNDFQAEYLKVAQRSLNASATLQTALTGASLPALPTGAIALSSGGSITLANESIAKQLRVVAQMIAAGSRLGMKRQVFMVSLSGFDCHAFQMRDQPLQMARVAQSVGWFMDALQGLGLLNNVTLFTASDFGRTLINNGDGSDHGWGGHHLVAGGAVKGKRIIGNFPVTALGTASDIGSGRLLPTMGVSQLAGSLSGWMGLSSTEQQVVLPNLSSFGAGPALFS